MSAPTSAFGTNRTNRTGLTMSVDQGGIDRKWLAEGQTGAIDPTETSA